jgi:hypothetical protein
LGGILNDSTPYTSNQISLLRGKEVKSTNAGMFGEVLFDDNRSNKSKDFMRQYKLHDVYENFKISLFEFMKLSIVETYAIIELCQEFNKAKEKILNADKK